MGKSSIRVTSLTKIGISLILLMFAAQFLFADIKAAQKIPRIFGLVIGINQFKDKYLNLQYASSDAENFYEALFDQQDSDAFLHIDQTATRENILASLSHILKESNKGDFIIFYVSTHGLIKYNDFYFCPHDVDIDNILGTGIPASIFINALSQRVTDGVNVLMIFDTCHSGSIGFDISKCYNEKNENGMGMVFSCSPLEASFESASFGGGYGALTYGLVQALSGKADENLDYSISVREMFNYTYDLVKKITQGKQNPVFISALPNHLVIKKVR